MSRAYTQRDKVIDYIKKFGSITSFDAYKDLGITQLATRIFELKERGHKIITTCEKGVNRYGDRIRYYRYVLQDDEGEQDEASN